jgi:hypothetical protein
MRIAILIARFVFFSTMVVLLWVLGNFVSLLGRPLQVPFLKHPVFQNATRSGDAAAHSELIEKKGEVGCLA